MGSYMETTCPTCPAYWAKPWNLWMFSTLFVSFATGLSQNSPSQPAVAPFIMPLRREAIPVYHGGKLVSFKTSYSGLVHVGSPHPQELRVVFDTGSGHIVLPSVNCHAPACLNKTRYDYRASRSGTDVRVDGAPQRRGLRDSVTIGFGKGQVEGHLVKDRVCLGPLPQSENDIMQEDYCVDSGLVTAYNMSSDPFENFTFDGIVGLGLKGLAVSSRFSFLHNLVKGGGFASGQFGVFLAEGDDEEESEISFGGHNPAHLLEPLTWVPLAKPELGWWTVEVLGVHVGDTRMEICNDPEAPCIGILDTGTSHLGLPSAHLDALDDLLIRPAGGLSDCRKVEAPTVVIELQGFNLTILPENYMRRLPLDRALLDETENWTSAALDKHDNETAPPSTKAANITDQACTAKLMTVKLPPLGPNAFLLGEPALHRYYTAYDASEFRAGFGLAARRKYQPPEPETEVNHDEVFLMQQMRGIRPRRPKAA